MSNLPTLPGSQSALPDAWIDRLFDRFATMYGNTWFSKWAGVPLDEVKRTWAEDLAFADAEQLKRALEHCKTNATFPPSSAEFAGLCKQFKTTGANHLFLPDKRRGDGPPGGFQSLRSVLRRDGHV